jgi:hypothetical protein
MNLTFYWDFLRPNIYKELTFSQFNMTCNIVYKSLIVKISECFEKRLSDNYLVFLIMIFEKCTTKMLKIKQESKRLYLGYFEKSR